MRQRLKHRVGRAYRLGSAGYFVGLVAFAIWMLVR